MNESSIDKNFLSIIEILKKNKLKYWLGQGTLLGIVRDGNLIDWDHDIDICMWPEEIEKEKIVNMLKDNNFVYRDDLTFGEKFDQLSFDKPGGRRVDINIYQRQKLKDNTIVACVKYGFPRNKFMSLIDAISFADVYSGKYKKLIKKLRYLKPAIRYFKNFLIKKGLFYKAAGYMQPIELLKEFKQIDFYGIKVTVPVESEKYLEFVYGENWKQPVKNFTWWKLKNINTYYG